MMIKPTTCPHCGRTNEIHSNVDNDCQPAPGDVSICWGCSGLVFYTEDGMRVPTDEERGVLHRDERIQRVLRAMKIAQSPLEALYDVRGDAA
jgi:hypothetical protein